ncbi:DUF262 domain-containing protein [Microbacterium sp.]|uniref:DUF262 domain-containing protein n=1 Tax=Microbacterium sp. TaxID=51671 RepID=UPI002D7918B7|nr:DUF262 domain-containing protein [Microbacterium sp.]HET6300229.1 DUF262 domain-containing protein [Microbacterium sp.]
MIDGISGDDAAVSASVGELVTRRLSQTDRWNLALVQRDEVWDELRMRHLLDSLLADYPIGAILLSTVRDHTRELIVRPDGSRAESDAESGSWQVLDGQQRINAMFSIFTDQGNYGHFLLDMLMERPSPAPAQGRGAKERAIPHIRHLRDPDQELESRGRFVDLSRWADWAGQRNFPTMQVDESTIGELLHGLDPRFDREVPAEERSIAVRNLNRLIRAWTRRSVPILRARMDTPLDVLEVFSRINLGGVNVAGADVYFAGVKTFWRDAEARLDEALREAPMLRTRLGALRFLSRLASRAIGHGDVLPLTVDRLTGKKGDLLHAALAEITEPGSVVRARLASFASWYAEESSLGYVLHQVTPDLWDDVLAWAVAFPGSDAELYRASLDALDAYLLGATMFRYRSVMGDTFRRIAFHEALDAGSAGLHFPLAEIVSVVRAKTRLRGSRGRAVAGTESQEELANLASRNGWILTALAQRIPYRSQPDDDFDWDHIFPQAQAHRMWAPGRGGRRRHHPDRHLINSTGNFWALNSSANRSLQDISGRKKFDLLLSWLQDGEAWRVWEPDRWSISAEEIEDFIRVDEKLNGDPASIDEAMVIFKATVIGRSRRLLDEALARFPLVRTMADDPQAPMHDPGPKQRDYRDALGLSVGDLTLVTLDRTEARARLRERARHLGKLIEADLRVLGLLRQSWPWEPKGGGASEMAFAAFELVGGNCIELMLKWDATSGARFELKAYPSRGRPSRPHLYAEFAEIPLESQWTSDDHVVVDEFLRSVRRLQEIHPR